MSVIYDIFVIKSGGLPLFAGCTGTKFCKLHFEQHELVAGFLEAIRAFTKETFNQSILENIIFHDMMISFLITEDLMFVFFHEKISDLSNMKKSLEKTSALFYGNFNEELKSPIVQPKKFYSFTKILIREGIITKDVNDITSLQKIESKHQRNRPRLYKWLQSVSRIIR